ncbi:hypothetical protein NBRC116584_28090 [Hydrogenophaga sp. 5NK40-0174]
MTSVQRRSLVMEIYNPHSIVQVSEVLQDLTVRAGEKPVYTGKGVVVSLLNTGLMAVASVTLIDEWKELNAFASNADEAGEEALRFVQDWEDRFKIRQSYQVVVSELRTFLSETSRWIDQADLVETLPKELTGQLRDDVFWAIAAPLMRKGKEYLDRLEVEAAALTPEESLPHRMYAQTALHPLILRAPFVYRTFAKPLGYAGDYEMVNQILGNPRQGETTYIQVVNATFLRAAVAQAHRNRIGFLIEFLEQAIAQGAAEGRKIRILNVGCGPAGEIQQLIASDRDLGNLHFTLLDFSDVTLNYTREKLQSLQAEHGRELTVDFIQESVHNLLKKPAREKAASSDVPPYDFVYCAGLFDYLSDKVCSRLIRYFMAASRPGGKMLLTNVHKDNPERHGMEHLLEWHLIYRNEEDMEGLVGGLGMRPRLWTDPTGVNVFSESSVPTGESSV